MSKYIEHEGIIVAHTAPHKYAVKIVQQSACATCKAASLCTVAESKEKIIDAETDDTTLSISDNVIVYARTTMGYKALVLAIIIPLFIAIGTLLIVSQFITNELTTGLLTLCVLIPYYIVLWLMRKRLEQQFIFYIKQKI